MASGWMMRWALGAWMAVAGGCALASAPNSPSRFESFPTEVRRTAGLALDGDARGRPFAIIDKKAARLYVFHADGRLAGASPALLGLARGDVSPPGVGQKVLSGIPPGERITPAGRFDSEPGRNLKGEAIVWFDYEAALAIHRLRPAPAAERRPQRLASDEAEDKRISLGCVVVAGAFYDEVVAPLLGRQRGVVYVLPEMGEGGPLAGGPIAAPRL
ncbi:L,D-transpeptidase [Roseateles sp. DAIF2]|nr:L,D-transpeptidase [Roseateles sp. DAIF2]